MPAQTPSQTVGPFFSHALTPVQPGFRGVAGNRMADSSTDGTPVLVKGRVTDGAGDPVTDAMIEVWQADHRGRYPDGTGSFQGFGRAATDKKGTFSFRTIKPGPAGPDAAPHLAVAVFARGMLNHAFTRVYFSDEAAANRSDRLLSSVERDRRTTLIAARLGGSDIATYEFNIRLQGDRETVFLDI